MSSHHQSDHDDENPERYIDDVATFNDNRRVKRNTKRTMMLVAKIVAILPVVGFFWLAISDMMTVNQHAKERAERREMDDGQPAVPAGPDVRHIDQRWVTTCDGGHLRQRMRVAAGAHGDATYAAYQEALKFFARTQESGGWWDPASLANHCSAAQSLEEGGGREKTIALTGLIISIFLADGHTPDAGVHRQTVKQAVSWLASQTTREGLIHHRIYTQAIASRALIAAWACAPDESVGRTARAAAEDLINRITLVNGDAMGWGYTGPAANRIDSSVSAWGFPALQLAKQHGLIDSSGNPGAFVATAWRIAAISGDEGDGAFPYIYNSTTDEVRKTDRWYLGLPIIATAPRPDATIIAGLVSMIDSGQLARDAYAAAHTLHGLANLRHTVLDAAYAPLAEHLIAQQRTDDCLAGSWDPHSARFHGSNNGGRLLVTAMWAWALAAPGAWH